jgi:cell volume regulation protein A
MDLGASILLTLSGLVIVALAAAAAGERVGAPLLLVFLAVGVLAGPEGAQRIVIEDPDAAFTAASAALAVILVDGGLRTRPETLALGLRPGLALATLGTLLTAGLTALAAAAAFGIGWREALLIGAIVSSTDAAAVFALIGGAGAKVKPRLAATLEVESGVNDPVAVFLTVSLAGALAHESSGGPLGFGLAFLWQAVGGLIVGGGAGAALARITPKLRLAPGLRPILVLAGGLFAFAFAQGIGASGFLAAYVFGVAHARRDRGVVEAEARALDGFAWLAQLALFLILGLLAAPSHIAAIAGPALAVALALTLIARPLAVLISLAPFRFTLNERLFAAWAGLRGATPIFLGLAPAALGAPNASLYFSLAFVAVGLSLVAQGWTTPLAARVLGVGGEAEDGAGIRIGVLRGVAVAAAVTASVAASVMIVRIAAPPPALTVSPASVAELEAAVGRPGGALVARLPEDWASLDPARRPALFAAAVGPLVEAENALLRAERAEVLALIEGAAIGAPSSLGGEARRDLLARAYGVGYADLEELQRRVDIVPPRLAIAQAAHVTGWGTSDAALQANALYGRRPSGERGRDGEGGARRFDTLAASVVDYVETLNTHPDFTAFREARAAIRAQGRTPTAEELVPYVAPFASEGESFAAAVGRILETLPPAAAAGRAP